MQILDWNPHGKNLKKSSQEMDKGLKIGCNE